MAEADKDNNTVMNNKKNEVYRIFGLEVSINFLFNVYNVTYAA